MRFQCLIDWPISQGNRWLWGYAGRGNDTVDFVSITSADNFKGWGKLLGYYPTHIALAIKALYRSAQQDYDMIVAWEGKNGFPLALLRALIRRKIPPLVVLSFSVRGPVTNFRRLMRFAMRGLDYVTVPTRFEVSFYQQLLSLQRDRVSFCPLGVYDIFGRMQKNGPKSFVLSGGRSGRDYATLFQAIQGTDIPLVLDARPFNLKGLAVPPNVTCNDILPIGAFRDQLINSQFLVVPLENVPEAVGLSSILYGMAAGKAVIASDAPGVSDYIEHGRNGWLVSAKDPVEMREAIKRLWSDEALARRLGAQAREDFENHYTFERFAERVHKLLWLLHASRVTPPPNGPARSSAS